MLRFHLALVILAIIKQTTNVDKDVGGKKATYTVGGNVNSCNHYGNQYDISSEELKIILPFATSYHSGAYI
jgi:hypothetical protein